MKLKTYSKVLSAMAVSALLLSACSSGGDSKTNGKENAKVDTSAFKTKSSNTKADVSEGIFNYGLVSDTPFEGILNRAFYEGQPDWEVLKFFDESLLGYDDNFIYDQSGAATYKLSNDNKTITLKIKDNVKWHNGDPVTAEDLEYAYEVIGSPKYAGARYDTQMSMVEGMAAYHAGKAKKISGIKITDPHTISITFTEANASMLTGLWATPLPKKYLAGIPVDKIVSSDQIRKKPIGFGPYKVKSIVQGESVTFEANNDYWKGKPKMKGVVLRVVNPQIATASLQKGDLDAVGQLPVEQYDQAKKLKNVEILGTVDLAYSYIGFKMGHYDAKKGVNVMDPNNKFKDKRLRQAMGFALDNKTVGEKLFKGLRFPATTVVPPSFPKYYDKDVKGFTYNKDKAKKLLDEAGYKDTNKDGFREDPNGKEFKLNFASMSGSDISEPLAKFYIQSWKDVGLNVQLLDGRLHEFNSFYDKLKKDDPKVDIYSAAWGTGSDPDPSGIWAKEAPFNYTRWVNDENDKLLKEGISPKAFDESYRTDVYNKWQELIDEEAPVIPTLFRYTLAGFNKRVKGAKMLGGEVDDWYDVSVTSESPEK
ncbi:oligopeptide ABC transporter substrate-binding protein [Peribacillus sp. B-H-3]|uniref:oligopeptide ABC transporter substrate-binding protein n=1 Tax=Peribacillus sp. B-H-3 TaxID=3400420 RepID=UPI003B022151